MENIDTKVVIEKEIKETKDKKAIGLINNLSVDDIKFISDTYYNKELKWDVRMKILTDKFGTSERYMRNICSVKLNLPKKIQEDKSEHVALAKLKTFDKTKKVFLISNAQNATKVNKNFLKNMECYADYHNGEILIIPTRYHNPGSIISQNDKNQEWWDKDIVKYLTLNRLNLNKNVVVLGDIKTQPTASMPLNGFAGICGNGSAILGHPRVQMSPLPRIGETPKMLFTTGSCTVENYTDTKAGKIGEFHHTLGFIIVEIIDNETYYIRQVTADNKGNFNDLYFNTNNGKITRNETCEALVKGDIHYGNHDQNVLDVSFNQLVPKLKPKQIFLHDVFDGYSINHHEDKNWIKNFQNRKTNKDCLKTELENLSNWLESIKQHNITLVFSNHDDFLNRFIINGDFKKNLTNSVIYLELAKILAESNAPNGLLAHFIKTRVPEINTLGRDDSCMVLGWECAVHGMDGINGTRGSIQQYKNLNTHIIIGHSHSPNRFDGAIQVGTNSKLKMGYNNGMSSWMHCDAIIHHDKKVQQIFYIGKNKEFTSFI